MSAPRLEATVPAPWLGAVRRARDTLPWDGLLAYGGLALLGAGGLWIALGAASNDLIVDTASADEPGWVRGPLAGLVDGLTNTGFGIALLLMLAGYVLTLVKWRALAPRIAVGVLLTLVAAFALAPPILSSDLFGYIGYGRLGVVHHLNPYTHGVIAAHDPILSLVYWQHPTSPYGPLFTLGSYTLATHSLPTEVWTYKVLGALALLVSLALVWQAATRMGRPPLRAVLMLGANPLLLVFAVGGAHNDLFVMVVVLATILILAAGRAMGAGAAVATAAAVKVTGGILLPLALAGSPQRRRVAAGAALAAIPLVALTLVVFGTHVFDTIGHIATGGAFATDDSGPGLVGKLLGTGITTGVLVACGALCAVAFALALRAAYRNGDWLTAAGWATLALLFAIQSFQPWYLPWLLPMAALTRSRALRVAAVLLTAVVIGNHLPLLGFAPST